MKPTASIEEWRPIPGYPNYEASSAGRVRSVDRMEPHKSGGLRKRHGRVLKPATCRRGYLFLQVSMGGVVTNLRVNRAVALAFHGLPTEAQPLVRHLDGVPCNNTPDNLAWGTHSENAKDRDAHGTMHRKYPYLALAVGESFTVPMSDYFALNTSRRKHSMRYGGRFAIAKIGPDLVKCTRTEEGVYASVR